MRVTIRRALRWAGRNHVQNLVPRSDATGIGLLREAVIDKGYHAIDRSPQSAGFPRDRDGVDESCDTARGLKSCHS
jgi:hypothetical protein